MKKKVLIYLHQDSLAPVGGPRGYVYNLMLGWNDDDIEVNFLEKKNVRQTYHKLYEKLPRIVKNIHKSRQNLRDCKFMVSDSPKISNINLNNYDAIHFHSTFDFYNCKDSLKTYKGKTLLTSHSPKPLHLEKIEDGISEKDRNRYLDTYMKLEKVDEYAFNNADYIIFPCEEAEEPYFNRWERFNDIKNNNKDRFRYMLSGVKKCSSKLNKSQIRTLYGIPDDSFVITYVGRHNEVKGYDILKKIGKTILEKYKNVYILCAGKEGPIYKLNHERWIEVGWTDDPYSIINSSDIFVLPNRETYFDLVLLEVLSIGTPIVASRTGGNKYFNDLLPNGIKLYDSIDECISIISELINSNKEILETMKNNNIKLFDKMFNEKSFAERYRIILNEIL